MFRWVMTAVGQPLERQELVLDPPRPGEVTVEVAGCGVCHTDLGYLYDGVRPNHALPLTLGHEIAGRVIAAGDGAQHWVGQAVVVPAVVPCGECDACQRGKESICPHQKMPGNDVHGGYATHVNLPAYGLCPVNEKKLAQAGLTLADVAVVADAVTTPYQAVLQSELAAGQLAIVVGLGGVGGYCAQIARAKGATVVGLDVDDQKLELMGRHGVTKGFNVKHLDPKALKKEISNFAKERQLPTREWSIFECSGSAAGQSTAFGLLTHGSTLSVIGYTLDRVELRLSNLMALHARALGNWGCAPRHYPAALALVLDGQVNLRPFVEHHPLAHVNQVLEDLHHHKIGRRPVLIPAQ